MTSVMDSRVADIAKEIAPGVDWDMMNLLSAVASILKKKDEPQLNNKKTKTRDHHAFLQVADNAVDHHRPKEESKLMKKRKKPDHDDEYVDNHDEIEMEQEEEEKEEEEEEEELVLPKKKKIKNQTTTSRVVSKKKEKKKKNRSKKNDDKETVPLVLEDFPEGVISLDDMKHKILIQKKLFATDLEKQQNRFSIPINQLQSPDFITDEERIFLENRKKEITKKDVTMIFDSSFSGCGGKMKQGELTLRRWVMGKGEGKKTNVLYVLNGPLWYQIAASVGLRQKMEVKLWSFRMEDEKLCFYLEKV